MQQPFASEEPKCFFPRVFQCYPYMRGGALEGKLKWKRLIIGTLETFQFYHSFLMIPLQSVMGALVGSITILLVGQIFEGINAKR